MVRSAFWWFVLAAVWARGGARTECVRVEGSLACPNNPALVSNVRMDLKDEDSLPLEIDDQMGRTWTTVNGSFVLSGCGSDVGPFNAPDPYILIEHSCPSVAPNGQKSGPRKMQFDLVKVFLPKILKIGKIFLDDSDA